jgi:hypothetical protein
MASDSIILPDTGAKAPATREPLRVYLASRFSRLPELVEYAAELEATGKFVITSRWLRGGHDWVGTADEDIPVEHNARFAQEDLEDIDAADVIVCFTEPARSASARGGRHVEAGYAIARGMPILVVGHRENVFYCLPRVTFAPDWRSAVAVIHGMAAGHAMQAGRPRSQWLADAWKDIAS